MGASIASSPEASRSGEAMPPGTDIGRWRWLRRGRESWARGRTAVRGVVVWGLVLAIAGVGALPGVPLGGLPLEGCGGGRRHGESRGLRSGNEGWAFGRCPDQLARGGGAVMHERRGVRGPLRGGSADVGGAGGDLTVDQLAGGGVAGMHERGREIKGPLRGGAADVGGAGGDSGAGKKDGSVPRRLDIGGRLPSLHGISRKFDKKKKAGKSFAVREVRPFSASPTRRGRIRRWVLIHRSVREAPRFAFTRISPSPTESGISSRPP